MSRFLIISKYLLFGETKLTVRTSVIVSKIPIDPAFTHLLILIILQDKRKFMNLDMILVTFIRKQSNNL